MNKKLSVTAALCCLMSSYLPVQAQSDGASVTVAPLVVEGLVTGNRYLLDQGFAQEHNIPVPAPFAFIAPTDDDQRLYVQPAPGGTGIIKVSFTSLADEVRSNLQFIPITIGEGPIEARLNGLRGILEQAINMSVPDLERADLLAVQNTEIGANPAIEALVRYDGGADGLVILRVVAIPNPQGVDGILAIINALVKNTGMQSANGIYEVNGSRALGTFRFQ